jgi:hypothetical protein
MHENFDQPDMAVRMGYVLERPFGDTDSFSPLRVSLMKVRGQVKDPKALLGIVKQCESRELEKGLLS